MDLVQYRGKNYPRFQTIGNASQFAIPFAKYFCQGQGYDIGCNRIEWSYPGSIPIDPVISQLHDAYNLPPGQVDYIFSSHCLEHVENWVDTLLYWLGKLNPGGTLFLYLPDFSQAYWRPWNNRKHRSVMSPEIIKTFLKEQGCSTIFVSGVDLNNSFTVMCTTS